MGIWEGTGRMPLYKVRIFPYLFGIWGAARFAAREEAVMGLELRRDEGMLWIFGGDLF